MKPHKRKRIRRMTYSFLLLLALSAAALAVISPYLSPVVEHDLPPVEPAVSLSVSGFPDGAHAGDVFRVTAILRNNANRPLPAVLRMEVRNVNTTVVPGDITVYAGCGAEEAVSSRTIRYYLGSHGPLLAPNGTRFLPNDTVATVASSLGDNAHWDVVLREIEQRDPNGYASLINPGTNASQLRTTASPALRVLYYFDMVTSKIPGSADAADWVLTVPFSDTWSPTDGVSPGFQVEIAPTVRGGFSFKLWAELPDGLGLPSHATWMCGPL